MQNLKWKAISNKESHLYNGDKLLAKIEREHNYYKEYRIWIVGWKWNEQPTFGLDSYYMNERGEKIILNKSYAPHPPVGIKNAKEMTLEILKLK